MAVASRRFALDIAKFNKKTEVSIDTIVRKVSLELLIRLIAKSPVDTGRFRGNWQVESPTPNLDVDPEGFDRIGTVTMARGLAKVKKLTAGPLVWITNNVSYGEFLERGHSKQAPKGVLMQVVQSFPGIVERAARSGRDVFAKT